MYHVYLYRAGVGKLDLHSFATYKTLFDYLTSITPATIRPTHLYTDSEDEYINRDEIEQLLYAPLIFWLWDSPEGKCLTAFCNQYTLNYYARILRTDFPIYLDMQVVKRA